MTRLLPAALAVGLLSGCAGTSCDELAGLQVEREERRASQRALIAGPATDDEIAAADDRLHVFERRVFEREQDCDRS